MDKVRKILEDAVADGSRNYAELSKAIGKNHAYLQQFVKRGIPRNLPEEPRYLLASVLGIDEAELRGPGQNASASAVPPAPASRKFLKTSATKFYVKAWRELMGVSVGRAAKAAGMPENEYQAHEIYPINFTLGQVAALADEFGIRGDQFWWPAPKVPETSRPDQIKKTRAAKR